MPGRDSTADTTSVAALKQSDHQRHAPHETSGRESGNGGSRSISRQRSRSVSQSNSRAGATTDNKASEEGTPIPSSTQAGKAKPRNVAKKKTPKKNKKPSGWRGWALVDSDGVEVEVIEEDWKEKFVIESGPSKKKQDTKPTSTSSRTRTPKVEAQGQCFRTEVMRC